MRRVITGMALALLVLSLASTVMAENGTINPFAKVRGMENGSIRPW